MVDQSKSTVLMGEQTGDQHDNHTNHKVTTSPIELLKNIDWPFDTPELYKIAFNFFKENESKAFHPSYDQRVAFIAYTLQEKYGKFNADKARPLGALDFVGHDRRNAWIALESMSKSDAQLEFIKLLDTLCPLFRPYVIAVKCDLDEKERKRKELKELERQKQIELEEQDKRKAEEEKMRIELEKKQKYEEQKRIIQDILNRQTIHQFGSYAKQQYPDNPELQQQLITQLQEQHFQQYIQQMMEQSSELFDGNVQSLTKNLVGDESNTVNELETRNDSISREETITQENTFDEEEDDSEEEEEEEEEETMNPANRSVSNASMWTRKDIDTFKDTIRTEGGDGILKVGHGEIATIRVPTHENGNCIFWEFATDSYDIGFGLLFEWNSTPGNQLSIHISESEDEDDEEGESDQCPNDVEKGTTNSTMEMMPSSKLNNVQSSISVIIPIYRRDSHEEVFAGSHSYPGKGVYLFKFDNSYSLWRSKTLYYRVYYTKET
ncbi:Golgi resident protein GCP60 [Blomia tropicalis]|nr:Golgi resident protein GCP60 [Blomia tropicalis]